MEYHHRRYHHGGDDDNDVEYDYPPLEMTASASGLWGPLRVPSSDKYAVPEPGDNDDDDDGSVLSGDEALLMRNFSNRSDGGIPLIGSIPDSDVNSSHGSESNASGNGGSVRNSARYGMKSSVLRFHNLSFVVGKKDAKRNILSDVSATVKWGHVLAVMGPSGAGKTTLLRILTSEAFNGLSLGSVTLNGENLTDKIFKDHCYVVAQDDTHWPYITCYETLRYAAELYDVAHPADIAIIVDEVLRKMGLANCSNVRNVSLSGGQRRRLSLAIALLKQPTVLLLDEPTTGLDAASSEHTMQEIVRLAKEERLIVMCTIHQPSAKVYHRFDQVMLLSKGRVAFAGAVGDAAPYFEGIGYPTPVQTNPAEHFLDLVNADFGHPEQVERILNKWQRLRPNESMEPQRRRRKGSGYSSFSNEFCSDISDYGPGEDEEQEGVAKMYKRSRYRELSIMLRRHTTLMIRDPVLFLGKGLVYVLANVLFALVFLSARSYDQMQAVNKMWISIWFAGLPTAMGVVNVYGYNQEFRMIVNETKNGMLRPTSWVMAKLLIGVPMVVLFGVMSLTIPSFVIIDFPWECYGWALAFWTALAYIYESLSECLAVWFKDPIMGMLIYLIFWMTFFLFGGVLVPEDDVFWPFKALFYVTPFTYFVRGSGYNYFRYTTWDICSSDASAGAAAVCVTPPTGLNVLNRLSVIFEVVSDENTMAVDLVCLVAIAVFFKIVFVIGANYNCRTVTRVHADSAKLEI